MRGVLNSLYWYVGERDGVNGRVRRRYGSRRQHDRLVNKCWVHCEHCFDGFEIGLFDRGKQCLATAINCMSGKEIAQYGHFLELNGVKDRRAVDLLFEFE